MKKMHIGTFLLFFIVHNFFVLMFLCILPVGKAVIKFSFLSFMNKNSTYNYTKLKKISATTSKDTEK